MINKILSLNNKRKTLISILCPQKVLEPYKYILKIVILILNDLKHKSNLMTISIKLSNNQNDKYLEEKTYYLL